MGLLNRFVCENCQYTADLSGGKDYGGISHVQTMACGRCRELVDVVVATDSPDDGERQQQIGRCPRCGATDGLSKWGREAPIPTLDAPEQHPTWGICPKCGGNVGFDVSIGIWDG